MSSLSRKPVTIEVVEDRTPPQPSGFLHLRRVLLRVGVGDALASEPYAYDFVERRALDAVVLVLYDVGRDGALRVLVRSNVRPPLAFREGALREQLGSPLVLRDGSKPSASTVELPAGLIEPDEIAASPHGEAALRACATREALEETGHVIALERWALLGSGSYLSPGLCAERIWFLAAEIPREAPLHAHGDGSPLERGAETWLERAEVLVRLAREGAIDDLKTEVGIARLRDAFADGSLARSEPAEASTDR